MGTTIRRCHQGCHWTSRLRCHYMLRALCQWPSRQPLLRIEWVAAEVGWKATGLRLCEALECRRQSKSCEPTHYQQVRRPASSANLSAHLAGELRIGWHHGSRGLG